MKTFIPTTQFAAADYLGSAALFVSPWVFGFAHSSGAASLIPMYMGGILLLMATFADNKLGLFKSLPNQMHMVILMFSGFFLMVSPWLFNFADVTFLPTLLFGALFMVLSIFTQNSPFLTSPHRAVREAGIQSLDANEGRLMV
ncbi:MAG: hypothetical protein ABIN91_20530 [Mucilaginibacter sp.]|uniref:SPW repeat domain-containing protein n=1 Tax=Mucilaginibacter sp. TaxID=1882438 RepID=UPI0032657033